MANPVSGTLGAKLGRASHLDRPIRRVLLLVASDSSKSAAAARLTLHSLAGIGPSRCPG